MGTGAAVEEFAEVHQAHALAVGPEGVVVPVPVTYRVEFMRMALVIAGLGAARLMFRKNWRTSRARTGDGRVEWLVPEEAV